MTIAPAHIDTLVQDCSISGASCTKPSIYHGGPTVCKAGEGIAFTHRVTHSPTLG